MTKLNENIRNVANNDIKDKILSLNKSQLELIRDASCFIGFRQIMELEKDFNGIKSMDNTISLHETNLLDKYLKYTLDQFNYLLNPQGNTSEELRVEDLMEIREEILKMSSIMSGYEIELSYVGEMVDEYGIKLLCDKDYKNTIYNSQRIEELIDYIMVSLEESRGDYNKYINIVSELVLILPMRLTKANYYGVLKNGIIRNLQSSSKAEVKSRIEGYKKQFNSSLIDGYGTKFDYYFREVQKLKNTDLSHKELEDLDEVVKSIIELTKEINKLYSFIFNLGLIVNKIIVINLLKDIPFSKSVKDSYKNWTKILKDNGDIEKFQEEIERKTQDIEESIFISLDEFNLLNNEALTREDFNYDDLSEELLQTRKILTIYNDINLSDIYEILEKGDELTTYEYLDQRCNSLIQYVNRALSTMSNMERKTRMRRLLSLIELPFEDMEKFMEFIRYSLDNRIISDAEVNFKIDYILYFLKEIKTYDLE